MSQNRYYSSPALSTTLAANITSTSATTITVTAAAGLGSGGLQWPASFPYTIGVDWGTTSYEAMEVTGVSGSSPTFTLTVSRGQDGTTAATHTQQAYPTVFHLVSGQDVGEPAVHLGAMGATTYPVTGNAVAVHGVTNTPAAAGYVVTSDSATAASWKTNVYQPAGTYVTSVTGTSPVVSSGGTTPAISMPAATSAAPGYMTSAQAGTVISNWIDVTQQSANPVLASQSAATNQANLTTILNAAPNGATIYFPGNATAYSFTGGFTLPAKMFTFQGQGQNRAGSPATAYTMLTCTTAADTLFTLDATSYWYTTFNDICFVATVTQASATATVNVNGNVGVNFRRCSFQGNGGTWYNCIQMTGDSGSNSGNQTTVDGCNFQGWTNYGISCSAAGSSLVVTDTVMNGNGGAAAAGIQGGWVGAMQIDNCDIIGCVNNLLLNPVLANSEVCASVFVSNTYFDNSSGSCVLITGTGATVRCKFLNCSFTVAAGSTVYNAVQVNSTFAFTTTAGQGLDFIGCNVFNTFGNTGASNGFNITGAADFRISECNIAGWVGSGITVTPIATSGVTKPVIMNNMIGPCGGLGANGTGLTLAASTNYGNISIQGNNLSGNTTAPYAQGGVITPAAGSAFYFSDNLGCCTPVYLTSAFTIAATATGTAVTGMTTYLPVGQYNITGTMIGLETSTAAVHDFAWVASGGLVATGTTTLRAYFGISTAGAAAVPTLSFNADATYTATMVTTSLSASDYVFFDFQLFLVVTTAGTITLDAWGATASTLALQIGSFLNFTKVA